MSSDSNTVHAGVLRLLAVVGGVLLIALSLVDNSATRLFVWPWYFYAQCLYLLPALALIFLEQVGSRITQLGLMWDIALLSLAVTTVLSGMQSPHPWVSLGLAAPYLFSIALVYVLATWLQLVPENRQKRLRLLANIAGGIFALVNIYSLLTWLVNDAISETSHVGLFRDGSLRNQHPFGHSNYTAGLAVLALPWLSALALTNRGTKRILWTTGTMLTLLVIPSTSSRGGVVGTVVVLIMLLLITEKQINMPVSRRWFLRLAALAGAFTLVLLEPRLRQLAFYGHWNGGATESNRQRIAMQKAGILMGKDRPLLGNGPGVVPLIYPLYRNHLDGGAENVLQLHNTPLQLWAELGITGSGAAVLLAIASALSGGSLILNLRLKRATDEDIFRAAAFAGLLAYGIFSITDYQLDLPIFGGTVAFYLAVLNTVGGSRGKAGASLRISSRGVVSTIITVLTLPVALAILYESRARAHSSNAYDCLAAGNESRFTHLSDEAAQIATWDPAYINQVAAVLLEKRKTAQDPARRQQLTREIRARFESSIAVNPLQEYAEFNLAWILLPTDPAQASLHFKRAAQLVPDKGGVYLGIALASISTGETNRAAAALTLECVNDPMFTTSPWWRLESFSSIKPLVAEMIQRMFKEILLQLPADSMLSSQVNYNAALIAWIMLEKPGSEVATVASTNLQQKYFAAHSHPTDINSAPTITFRRQRLGYPVIYRHPDIPPPVDEYEVQENAAASGPLRYLFPFKGWLPTPILAKLSAAILHEN